MAQKWQFGAVFQAIVCGLDYLQLINEQNWRNIFYDRQAFHIPKVR